MSKHPFLLRSTMAAMLVLLLLAGCSGGDNTPSESNVASTTSSEENGNTPSKSDIKMALGKDFEDRVKKIVEKLGIPLNTKIDIKAQENEGSKTEPEFHTRFVTTLAITEPVYDGDYMQSGGRSYIVLKKRADKGAEFFKLSGIAVSILKGEQWETNIMNLDPFPKNKQPNVVHGKPLAYWNKEAKNGNRQVVTEDSADYAKHKTALSDAADRRKVQEKLKSLLGEIVPIEFMAMSDLDHYLSLDEIRSHRDYVSADRLSEIEKIAKIQIEKKKDANGDPDAIIRVTSRKYPEYRVTEDLSNSTPMRTNNWKKPGEETEY